MGDGAAEAGRAWRLRPRARKTILVLHITSAGAWIGIDVVMAILVATALRGDDATRALAYRALELFAGWPLFATGMICLASGLILGLGTVYGLIRYWWVLVKLVLNIVLVSLVLLLLKPGVTELAEQGRRFADGLPANLAAPTMVFPPAVSLTALLSATILSVFKPWGLIRKRQEQNRTARRAAAR